MNSQNPSNTHQSLVATDDDSKIVEIPDSQVKEKQSSARRSFKTAYKIRILAEYDACSNQLARGELLRKEGLYSSRISTWRKERDNGKLGGKHKGKSDKKMKLLSQENIRLKKKLAQAEAIIYLQKKISDLLGEHILPTEMSELN